jgi:hypothetical protein
MREKQDALNTKRLDLLNSLRYEKRFFKPSKLDNLLTKHQGTTEKFRFHFWESFLRNRQDKGCI